MYRREVLYSIFALGEFLRYYDEKNRVQIERDNTASVKSSVNKYNKAAALRDLSEYAASLVTNCDLERKY